MSEPKNRLVITPALLDGILDEQRRRWRQGERVFVETFLAAIPDLGADKMVVLDLIYNELLLREDTGEQPQQQEYLERFPQLRAELIVQFEVERGLDWQLVAGAAPPRPSASAAPVAETRAGTPLPSLPGYEVKGVIGRGQAGVVYRALDVRRQRLVAVKVMAAGARAGLIGLARFRAEAESVARLRHPHIVAIHEIGVHEGTPFLTLELAETSLAARRAIAAVTPRQAAQWLESLARTVHYAHQRGFVHRNLHTANVMLDRNGSVKVTDFHLAEIASRPTRERPPADSLDSKPADDVYRLGTILYELLTGRQQEAFDPAHLPPQMPRDLEAICLRSLQMEPGERYATADALADDLSAFLAGKPIRSQPAGVASRLLFWVRGKARAQLPLRAAAPGAAALARLELTLALTRRLMWPTTLDALLPRLAEIILWLVDGELATIYLVDRDLGELWAKTVRGDSRLKLGAGVAGAVAVMGEPLNLPDARADPRFGSDMDQRTRNLLALPIVGAEGVTGVVEVINKKAGEFDAADVETLGALLTSAAIALERARR